MLSIDTIARVVINASRSVAVPSSFVTGLALSLESSAADAAPVHRWLIQLIHG